MRKLLFIFSIIFLTGVSFVACSSDDDNNEIRIGYNELPQTAKDFISLHFPGVTSNYIEKENVPDSDGTIYEAHLTNGFEVNFDINGNWTKVDGNYQLVPQSVLALIPQQIITYCATNYPNVGIMEVDKEPYGYKIDLTNNLDLRFDINGNFLGLSY